MSRRGSFTILLGLALTPLAGLLGVISSAMLPMWLFGLGLGLLAGPAVLGIVSLVTMFQGALYAWPLTCVALPLAAVFVRPVTQATVPVFALIGLAGGPLSFALISRMSDGAMHSDSFRSLAIASAFAGVVLGAVFGFALWRYDKLMLKQAEPVGSAASNRTVKMGAVLSAVFLIFALIGLTFFPQHDRCSNAAINRDKSAKTYLDFECARLRRNE